ncbi:ribonuclease 3 [Hydra vulgaris]|uniref:ribonuclease 3 n=1 Tax=Hydra vulgaris TaxID=6087 RepID=UPI001F5FC363|nr:ribonuclease 3-like [Hydra vulgaris]
MLSQKNLSRISNGLQSSYSRQKVSTVELDENRRYHGDSFERKEPWRDFFEKLIIAGEVDKELERRKNEEMLREKQKKEHLNVYVKSVINKNDFYIKEVEAKCSSLKIIDSKRNNAKKTDVKKTPNKIKKQEVNNFKTNNSSKDLSKYLNNIGYEKNKKCNGLTSKNLNNKLRRYSAEKIIKYDIKSYNTVINNPKPCNEADNEGNEADSEGNEADNDCISHDKSKKQKTTNSKTNSSTETFKKQNKSQEKIIKTNSKYDTSSKDNTNSENDTYSENETNSEHETNREHDANIKHGINSENDTNSKQGTSTKHVTNNKHNLELDNIEDKKEKSNIQRESIIVENNFRETDCKLNIENEKLNMLDTNNQCINEKSTDKLCINEQCKNKTCAEKQYAENKQELCEEEFENLVRRHTIRQLVIQQEEVNNLIDELNVKV